MFSTFPMRYMKIFSKHEIMVRRRVQNLISVNKLQFLLGVVNSSITFLSDTFLNPYASPFLNISKKSKKKMFSLKGKLNYIMSSYKHEMAVS